MAALLLAEGFVAVDRLKPWWRLWTYPCPLYTLMGEQQSSRPVGRCDMQLDCYEKTGRSDGPLPSCGPTH